ncbi:acriflavin resistance protein [Candidatus Ruthia magnifica str. Cm (Calyptogena magnifica)]|uniref:Acriflavin resistance protein n=1 Tax=Ruthia magnifica subsp. Calyptogena magnifica TaxID=413404 RepID=A1AW34_RUTMC|nr:efflux RND transporter permease subunit [Candidatus Ruthturnera calyptogenae]ABL02141.1 acriflavin resistance protein [Candidatus Ruthia magnifica str. Cm (Calyptogena magnifica)]
MDNILNFFVKQKKLALVFTVFIIALGLLTLSGIQRDKFPAVDFEEMSIVTIYPGASPEDVEQNVTNPIEDELRSISGIDKFNSTSKEGKSSIIVTLSQDISDIESLKQEIRNAVSRIKSLPEEVNDLPWVIDRKNSLKSILKINISSGELSYQALRDITDDMANSLALVEGVSKVVKEGYLDREIQIKVNPDSLYQHKLSLPQIIEAIKKRNKRYAVGSNHDYINEKTIVVLAKFDEIQAVGNVIIKSTFDGPIIRLKDVASIVDGNKEETSITRVNGTKGFILKIRKQENADIITTVDLIKEKVLNLRVKYPTNLQVFYSSDESKHVRNRLNIVINNGLIGLFLVLIILALFLSLKTAFWVSISLPISLLGTVTLLGATGETINLISLAAMILVLGIVVDDSIVMAESIHHYKQLGKDRYQSTVRGFKRVIAPVITTILTTILAFSSMFLMGGTMGKFIYVIPLVVIFALTLSFLEISLALPAHLASSDEKTKGKIWFACIEDWFEGFLTKVLKWRYGVVVIFSLVLIGTLYFAKTQMKYVQFPSVGADSISARLQMSVGTSLERTESISKQVEKMIIEVVGEDLDSLTNNVGHYFTHVAKFTIKLVPFSIRVQTPKALLVQLKARVKNIKAAQKLKFSIGRPGPPQGEDVEINLVGSDNIQRQNAADSLEKILLNIDGIDNIERDDEPGKTRIEVVIDFEKMARFDVDFSTINDYLKAAFTGINVTNVRYGDDDVDFRIYLGSDKQSEDFLALLKVNNRQGHPILLKQFISLQKIKGEPNFNHFNGQRSAVLSGSVDDEITTSSMVVSQALKRLDLANKYPTIRVTSEGGDKDTKKAMDNFKKAFIMAIFVIFLLLILLFNSYSQPILILIIVPFSIIGVIWAFFFHGETLSFFAILGTLALVGVIVNDSLVMVAHLNYLKAKFASTMSVYEWVVQGAKDRLRAVVLTTLTTLAGVMPLAYGIGGTDFILQPMVLSLGYGLLFGTLITLILLPCLYLINHDLISWVKNFGAGFKI